MSHHSPCITLASHNRGFRNGPNGVFFLVFRTLHANKRGVGHFALGSYSIHVVVIVKKKNLENPENPPINRQKTGARVRLASNKNVSLCKNISFEKTVFKINLFL